MIMMDHEHAQVDIVQSVSVYLITVGVVCIGFVILFFIAQFFKWEKLSAALQREEYRAMKRRQQQEMEEEGKMKLQGGQYQFVTTV